MSLRFLGRVGTGGVYAAQSGTPLHHYKFQEASGNVTDDGSVANDVTAAGTAIYKQQSPLSNDNSVLCGDQGGASSGRFQKTSGETFTVGAADDLTIVIWLKVHPEASEAFGDSAGLFWVKDQTNAYPRISVFFDTSERLNVEVYDDANAASTVLIAKADIWTPGKNDFKEVVIQGDREAENLAVRVDGDLITPAGVSGDFSSLGALTFSNDHINIGTRDSNSTKDFSGWIAEIWLDTTLSYTVNKTGAKTLQGGSPLHHYKMQMASGNAVDAGSVGNDVTATGTSVYQKISPIISDWSVLCGDQGGATSGRFQKTSGETFTIGASDSFTLVLWFKVHSSASEAYGDSAGLFWIKDGTNAYPRISAFFDTSERLNIEVYDDANAATTAIFAKADIWTPSRDSDTWMMTAIVLDRSGTIPTCNTNGSALTASGSSGDFSAMGALTFSNDHINIGTRDSNSTKDFSGWIAEAWLSTGTDYSANF